MYAFLASFAVGVEAVDPVVWDVAALDGSVDDVCVFHNTKFLNVHVCFLKLPQRYNSAQALSRVRHIFFKLADGRLRCRRQTCRFGLADELTDILIDTAFERITCQPLYH